MTAKNIDNSILDAVRSIFLEEGIKGLSIRKVADKANCTTIFAYSKFKGKNDMLGFLFDEGFEVLSQAQMKVNPKLSKYNYFIALCKAYRETAITYSNHYELMLGKYSGEHIPSENSQAKALGTLLFLANSLANRFELSEAKATLVANRLFAFCHGWVSLELIGFFRKEKKIELEFKNSILSILKDIKP